MENKQPAQASRGIGSIAHLFLSRPQSRPGRTIRRGPGQNSNETASISEKGAVQVDPAHKAPEKAELNPEKRIGVGVLCEHLECWQEKLIHFARQTSTHEGPVGLVSFDQGAVRLLEFGPAAQQAVAETVIDSAWQELFGTQQADRSVKAIPSNRQGGFWGSLDELDREIETLLIQIPESGGEKTTGLIKQCCQLVVFSGCEKSQIVDAYRMIKWVGTISGYSGIPGLFIFGAKDEQESASVFETLSKTAKRFLRIDLELAGREIPIDDDVRERQVAAMKMDDAVLEELVDCLAKPKEEDPGNDNPYNNVSGSENNQLEVNQAEPVELKKEPAESKRFPEGSKIYEPIMVRAFPQNDAELADQLEVSLAVWLKDKAAAMVLPLPALANVDRATRLIVDGSGQLWVVCGSLQESQSLLCRGLTARKWAVDHLSLIKGNFSQVKIEPVLPIGLILVSGGNLEPLRDSISQVGGIPCQILRLMFLQKDEQRSLVIV